MSCVLVVRPEMIESRHERSAGPGWMIARSGLWWKKESLSRKRGATFGRFYYNQNPAFCALGANQAVRSRDVQSAGAKDKAAFTWCVTCDRNGVLTGLTLKSMWISLRRSRHYQEAWIMSRSASAQIQ